MSVELSTKNGGGNDKAKEEEGEEEEPEPGCFAAMFDLGESIYDEIILSISHLIFISYGALAWYPLFVSTTWWRSHMSGFFTFILMFYCFAVWVQNMILNFCRWESKLWKKGVKDFMESYGCLCWPCNGRLILNFTLIFGEIAMLTVPYFMNWSLITDLQSGVLFETAFGFSKKFDAEVFSFGTWMIPGGLDPHGGLSVNPDKRSYVYDIVQNLKMDVYVPRSLVVPVIFHIPGFEYSDGDPSETQISIEFWIQQGYGFISVQYCLDSTCSSDDILRNLELAMNFARAQISEGRWRRFGYDRDQFVLFGAGSGGHIATLFALQPNSTLPIRGAINCYSPAEPLAYDGDKLSTQIDTFAGGQPLVYISPSTYASSASVPILSFHGTWDREIAIDVSRTFHEELTLRGAPNLLLEIETFDHRCDLGFYSVCSQILRFAMGEFLLNVIPEVTNTPSASPTIPPSSSPTAAPTRK